MRLWDRLFDLYLMTPMQAVTADLLRPQDRRDAVGASDARKRLASAYAFIDRHLAGRTWACGDAFSMADCAAAPALFYAVAYVPLLPEQVHLAGAYFPGRAGLSRRFFDPADKQDA